MMRHGWKVNITETGGSLSRKKERMSIHRQGALWTICLGQYQATAMLAGPLVEARTLLEVEHQRLGHIGRSKACTRRQPIKAARRLSSIASESRIVMSVRYRRCQDNPRVATALEKKGMANLFMPISLDLLFHHSMVMIILWR
jgi:hypothetical protein